MTTATCDHITRSEMLSDQERVRHNLARFVNKITNDGETIAQKYQDFVNGEYPDAKPYLIYAANTQLGLMSGNVSEDTLGTAIRVQPAPDAHADADGESEPRPKKPKITMKEILNWDIGRLIRQQTHDCRDLIVALEDIMHPPYIFPSANKAEKKYQKATRVRHHHEFAAMKEIYKHGIGSQNPDLRVKTSYLEERMLQSKLAEEIRNISDGGLDIVPYLLEVIRNPKTDRWNNIIEDPYTQTHRLWSIKHLLWRGVDIPWEHITPDDIAEYFRDLSDKQRQEAERRRAERKAAAQLTPEQEATIRALFEQTQRQAEDAEAKAAAKAAKRAKKAAKKAHAAKAHAHDYNNAAADNNADTDNNTANNGNANNAALDANSAVNNKNAANSNSAINNKSATNANNAENGNNGENGNSADNNGNANNANNKSAANGNSASNNKSVGNGNNVDNLDADNANNADNRNNANNGKNSEIAIPGSAANRNNGNNAPDGDNADNAKSAGNGNNGESADNTNNAENANNAAKDTGATDDSANANSADAPPSATAAPPPIDRGAIAVANAIDRHPQVDLDTALENHHSTAGVPKQNLTYAQIYDAIIAEANFQKRQAIIQRRLRPENPDAAPEDNDPPKSRSP